MSLNVVVVTGILAREPQLSYSASGPETRLDVRCFSREKDAGGNWKKVHTILPVVIRGASAERVAGWLKEGHAVEVEGRLQGFEFQMGDRIVKACAILARRVDQVKDEAGAAR
ncbi:MAG: single-stranded DNA-binding protein [Synergistaceae bacterium]|jgi:single-stranded DNA-binding protein|nr:single-stranded DNA-binding protein [Synergistaceae bacterium]